MRISSRRGIILIIVVGIIFVLSLNFFQKEVRGFFYTVSAPIQRVFWGVGDGISGFFETVVNFQNLKKENDELKSVIQELMAKNTLLQELKEENETLREALQISLQKDFQLTLVQVIGKDIGQESIIINQGAKEGLSLGMPVVTQEKVLLGRITEVYENSSRVNLISHEESSFDAKISGTNVTGVAKGRGGTRIALDLVPRDKTLQVGDLVVSSALGGIYPGGLLVGSIKTAEKNDVSPFYEAEISPFFDLQNITAVFIILNFVND